jgi:hypothetical protein
LPRARRGQREGWQVATAPLRPVEDLAPAGSELRLPADLEAQPL